MDCKEFRTNLENNSDFSKNLEAHLEKCKSCNEWLENFLVSNSPASLKNINLQTPGKNAIPDFSKYSSITNSADNSNKKEESFWDFYFSGIKYGTVFALAIIAGFALLPYFQTGSLKNTQQEKILSLGEISFVENDFQEISFMEKEVEPSVPGSEKIDSFFPENENFNVTFLEDQDTKLMSFVEIEQIPTFIENEKESGDETI